MELLTTLPARLPADTAVALGFFDGVHAGHRAVLAATAQQRLLRTAFTFSTTGRAPCGKQGGRIYPDALRARLIEENGIDLLLTPDFSAIADMGAEAFADFLCGNLRAKCVCCGEDYRFAAGASADAAELSRLCRQRGCAVIIVPPVLAGGERVSSTRIRERIRQGEIELAGRLLGEPYRIEGPVEHGQRLGHALGFPTLNQPLPEGGVLPRFGVYASQALVEGRWVDGVTNIGVRPSVDEGLAPRAETYLVGYAGKLYGEQVSLRLLGFLRPERRFASTDALRAQIAADCKAREGWQPGQKG